MPRAPSYCRGPRRESRECACVIFDGRLHNVVVAACGVAAASPHRVIGRLPTRACAWHFGACRRRVMAQCRIHRGRRAAASTIGFIIAQREDRRLAEIKAIALGSAGEAINAR